MAENSVKYDASKLEDLINSLKEDYTLRVGIIGTKAKKKHSGSKSLNNITNAELGTFHEFGGTSKTGKEHPPRRSFLEDSIKFKFNLNTEEMKDLRKLFFNQFFIKHAPKVFLEGMGAKLLGIVAEAFDTNGWGLWKPLTLNLFSERYDIGIKSYEKFRKRMEKGKIPFSKEALDAKLQKAVNPDILTDTGELRDSISFKVFKKNK